MIVKQLMRLQLITSEVKNNWYNYFFVIYKERKNRTAFVCNSNKLTLSFHWNTDQHLELV